MFDDASAGELEELARYGFSFTDDTISLLDPIGDEEELESLDDYFDIPEEFRPPEEDPFSPQIVNHNAHSEYWTQRGKSPEEILTQDSPGMAFKVYNALKDVAGLTGDEQRVMGLVYLSGCEEKDLEATLRYIPSPNRFGEHITREEFDALHDSALSKLQRTAAEVFGIRKVKLKVEEKGTYQTQKPKILSRIEKIRTFNLCIRLPESNFTPDELQMVQRIYLAGQSMDRARQNLGTFENPHTLPFGDAVLAYESGEAKLKIAYKQLTEQQRRRK